MAEMNPPHHEMSPMRVLMKITKADAPSLDEPSKWSPEFSDLIKQCLQKNPAKRPTANAVLEVLTDYSVGLIFCNLCSVASIFPVS